MWIEIIISAFILLGASFALTGSIGLFRMPDFYMRIHGPTKATTLGVGGLLVASMLYFTFIVGDIHLHEVLVTGFLFMTAPVSAHLASKAALHLGIEDTAGEVEANRDAD
jgi:multicomponent K+:H+ antiporter subunit G